MPEDGYKQKEGIYRGIIFEIDGHFPTHLHDHLGDYVPLPENRAFEPCPYMNQVVKEQNEAAGTNDIKAKAEVKLICDLAPRSKFVVHYGELKSALQHGFIITKIHREISFLQSRWMAPYILKIKINVELLKTKPRKNTTNY